MPAAEIDLLQTMGQIPVQQFTITGAEDWPMFLSMLKVLGAVIAVAWGSGVALVVYIWTDLKSRIGSQRLEDTQRCTECKSALWEHIDGPLWTAIKDCCGFMNREEQEMLRDNIKRRTKEDASCA